MERKQPDEEEMWMIENLLLTLTLLTIDSILVFHPEFKMSVAEERRQCSRIM